MFYDSGFTRTLCGGAWKSLIGTSNAFDETGSSTARLGCCSPGTFMNSSTSTVCDACPSGQYGSTVDDDITSCNDCGTGKYGDLDGQSACKDCGTGKYGDLDGLSVCKNCGTGKYNEQTGQSSESIGCKNCGTGKYNEQVGQNSESVACKNCVPGKYNEQVGQNSESVACKNCVPGKYGNQTGLSVCYECDTGDVSSTGSTNCAPLSDALNADELRLACAGALNADELRLAYRQLNVC